MLFGLRFIFILLACAGVSTFLSCKNEHLSASVHIPMEVPMSEPVEAIPNNNKDDFKTHLINRLHALTIDSSILNHLTITDSTVHWLSFIDSTSTVFSLNTLATLNEIEKINYVASKLNYSFEHKLNRASNSNTLTNIRIVLDPGHSAGDFETAKIEGKFLELLKANNPSLPKDIKLIESELTFHTALMLKKMLESHGAEVFLTRKGKGLSAMGYSFQTWLDSLSLIHIDSLLTQNEIDKTEHARLRKLKNENTDYGKKVLFSKVYNRIDFETRAQKINSSNPDITLVLHYNVDIKNDPWKNITTSNVAMAFVPGAFMKGETTKKEDEFHFIRLLFSDEIDDSENLSHCILEEIIKKGNVKRASKADSISYLEKYCTQTPYEGVYARNLALTRKVCGTITYLEPLYQDNILECLALDKKVIPFDDFLISKRVEDVANAYYNGIIRYLEHRDNKK